MNPSNTVFTGAMKATLSAVPNSTKETSDPILQGLWSLLKKTVKKADSSPCGSEFRAYNGLRCYQQATALQALIKNRKVALSTEPDSTRLIVSKEKQKIVDQQIENKNSSHKSDDYIDYQNTINHLVAAQLDDMKKRSSSSLCRPGIIAYDLKCMDLLMDLGVKIPKSYQKKLNDTLASSIEHFDAGYNTTGKLNSEDIKALKDHGAKLTYTSRKNFNKAIRKAFEKEDFHTMITLLSFLENLGGKLNISHPELSKKLSKMLENNLQSIDLRFILKKFISIDQPLDFQFNLLKDTIESRHDYLENKDTLSLVKSFLEANQSLKDKTTDYTATKILNTLDDYITYGNANFNHASIFLKKIARYKKNRLT